MLDYVYFIGLFSKKQVKSNQRSLHKLVLADLELFFELKTGKITRVQKNLFVGLMRYYDFLHDVEQ